MSNLTYSLPRDRTDKPLVWLDGEIKSPPLGKGARIEAGYLLRCLQAGIPLSMPHSRPMPGIGARCHEPRITDAGSIWRVIYRTDDDAIVILAVFRKMTNKTPQSVIENCRGRARRYDQVAREDD